MKVYIKSEFENSSFKQLLFHNLERIMADILNFMGTVIKLCLQ
jgi:hypothetical protein